MFRYIFKIREEELLKAYEEFPQGFEIVEKKPNGEYLIAVYSENRLNKFPFHLVREEKVVYKDWKEYYKPIEVSDKTVVIPPWEVVNEKWSDKTVIVINPGKAFGTGLHESTQLCLKLLEEIDLKDKKVLDIGSGSGILSIFAAKKGAKEIVAIDIDPLAVEETMENAKLNKVEKKIKALKGEPKDIKETFDIVIANLEIHIFREVLKDIVPLIGREAVFSGLFKVGDLIEFLQLGRREGIKPTKVIEKNDWYALRCEKVKENN